MNRRPRRLPPIASSEVTAVLGRIVLAAWFATVSVVALADVRVDYDRHKDFSQ
jgi:hypothetical protein